MGYSGLEANERRTLGTPCAGCHAAVSFRISSKSGERSRVLHHSGLTDAQNISVY